MLSENEIEKIAKNLYEDIVGYRELASTGEEDFIEGCKNIYSHLPDEIKGDKEKVKNSIDDIASKICSDLHRIEVPLVEKWGGHLAPRKDVIIREKYIADVQTSEDWNKNRFKKLTEGYFKSDAKEKCLLNKSVT